MESNNNVAVDRSILSEILQDAFSVLASRGQSEEVFAAPLGARVRDLLRIRTQNPDASVKGEFFGPILFPKLSSSEYSHLKFRHFLQAFPEVVDVFTVGSVDKVRLATVKPSAQYIEVSNEKPTEPQGSAAPAYLIIDSASFLDQLHHILAGEKPNQKTLPNWDQLRKYLQEKFPAKEWKVRFLMGVANAQNDGADAFRGYLEAIGFRVIPLKLKNQPSGMDEMISERSQATALAVSKLLNEIGNSVQDAHVFTVTHSGAVADALGDLLKKRRGVSRICVIGFPERMDEELISLKENGLLVVDIETEANVFKAPLPRRQLISPNDFNPAEYL